MKSEKLPSGSYRVQKQIAGKRYSVTFDHKPTQKEIAAALSEKANATVTLSNAPKKPFSECADKYFEVKKNVLSASTYRSDKSRASNLSEEFRNTIMSDIDNIVIQKEINRLSARLSPKSVQNYFEVIKNVIAMFMPDYNINVSLPKKKTKTKKYIPTPDEVKLILDSSIEKYWIMFMLGAYGLRRSEAIALEWPTDFDVKNKIIHIDKAKVYSDDKEWIVQHYNKTEESNRDVPVSAELIKRIKKQGYVYQGHPRKIIEYLNTKQKQLGIERFRYHDLRAYFATELDQAGFSSKDIQKLGGWSSDQILKTVYQHNRVEKDKEIQKRAAATIMDKLR